MSFEDILTHQIQMWKYAVWTFGIIMLKLGWNKAKKKGISEYDDYKKWESRFREEGRFK